MYRALTLALILSLLGCSDQTDTLRIGANRWLGYGPLYLADDLHWMTPSGYRLVEYPHTTGVLRGYRNGLLDAALLTLDEALILQSSGQPVQILLVADVSAGADVLFANAHIQQLAQLRGQRIGLARIVRILLHGRGQLFHRRRGFFQRAGLLLGARRQILIAGRDLR